jgi:hypothetical protein
MVTKSDYYVQEVIYNIAPDAQYTAHKSVITNLAFDIVYSDSLLYMDANNHATNVPVVVTFNIEKTIPATGAIYINFKKLTLTPIAGCISVTKLSATPSVLLPSTTS